MVECGLCMRKKLDYLTPLLEKAPASWALIRANEIRALERINFKPPVLDVGCGDGLVAKVILMRRGGKFDWGIDLSPEEIAKARKSRSYKRCRVANVYDLPFEDQAFSTVFSNSVLEHVSDLEKALSEMSRVLKNGGQLVLTTPSTYLTKYLWGTKLFGRWYGNFFNKLFTHNNLYTYKQWGRILKKYSLRLIDYHYYHTPGMIRVHEVLSYIAIPQHLFKKVFGFWPVFSGVRRALIAPLLRHALWNFYVSDSKKNKGGSLLLIAQKC